MGLFDWGESEAHHDAVYNNKHEGSFTHELVAGAAGFAALRAYNKHAEVNGTPHSHGSIKELLAGFAAAEVDKLIETKGLDYLDARKAKEQAQEQAEALYAMQQQQ